MPTAAPHPAAQPDRLLTADAAALYLGIEVSTLRAWTSRRKVPVVKLLGGRSVRYRQSDLERLVKSWSRPALRRSATPGETSPPHPEAPADAAGPQGEAGA